MSALPPNPPPSQALPSSLPPFGTAPPRPGPEGTPKTRSARPLSVSSVGHVSPVGQAGLQRSQSTAVRPSRRQVLRHAHQPSQDYQSPQLTAAAAAAAATAAPALAPAPAPAPGPPLHPQEASFRSPHAVLPNTNPAANPNTSAVPRPSAHQSNFTAPAAGLPSRGTAPPTTENAPPPPPPPPLPLNIKGQPPQAGPSRSDSRRVPQLTPYPPSPHHVPAPQQQAHNRGSVLPHQNSSPQPPVHAKYAPMSDPRQVPARPALPAVQLRRRTSIKAPSGHWILGKTVGAGSMGKVKLARNSDTGDQAAIKIVPRYSTDEKSPHGREKPDPSKDIRTHREAAIVGLVRHPYICGLHDVVTTQNHWYMFFEYVDGGQMLEYIISHGRLKEKQARKFARQIASALDYCHRNSIVHRDLKIENILISKTGDIKIIDFGLSNLFSPNRLLKTFCGSLYFAAPELLRAKQYVGPEVDIWSFGVVLYVLVCGKVPFDDQSMPQLHEKIKKGHTEYPPYISSECKNLISRMLTTDPSARATLQEVMNHPWMTKGFSGIPIDNYLPVRDPVTLPLDPVVIQGMTGFNFGPPEKIAHDLTKVVSSETYKQALHNFEHRRPPSPTPEFPERRRGMFEFYKRRNSASFDNFHSASSSGPIGSDPLNAFDPRVSVYLLVREKLGRNAPPEDKLIEQTEKSASGTALAFEDTTHPEQSDSQNQRLVPNPLDKAEGPSNRVWGRSTREEDDGWKPDALPVPTSPSEQPAKRAHSSTAGAILRRFSTRRYRDSSNRPTPIVPTQQAQPNPTASPQHSQEKPVPIIASPSPAQSTPRKSFSIRRSPAKTGPSSSSLGHGEPSPHPDLLSPPSIGDNFSRRLKALARSTSVSSAAMPRRLQERRDVSDQGSREAPHTSGSENSTTDNHQDRHHQGRLHPASAQHSVSRRAASGPSSDVPSRAKSVSGNNGNSSSRYRWRTRHTGAEDQNEDAPSTPNTAARMANESSSPEALKPVYLKGLFSASTTSTKPLKFIRSDIIRVLDLKNVHFTEIKGGFSCTYVVSNNGEPSGKEPTGAARSDMFSPVFSPSQHRRKISLGGFRHSLHVERREAQNADNSHSGSEESDASGRVGPPESHRSLRPHRNSGEAAPAETTTKVQQPSPSQPTLLRFEIFIVKVPLLHLYGIQFKKLEGNVMMQYKNLAQEILRELRL